MNRNDIDRLLIEAMHITNHRDFVIIGSLSVLGATENPPVSMTGSIDVIANGFDQDYWLVLFLCQRLTTVCV